MPGQMDGKSRAFAPRPFGRAEEYEPVMKAPLHFHHMSHHVNSTGMPGIECQRTTRHFLGAIVFAVLLKRESVHRKNAGVARYFGGPLRQCLRDPIAHHAAAPKMKVERVRNGKRKNVVRSVGEDFAVKRSRTRRVAGEPSTRGDRVPTRRIVRVQACCLDRGNACSKRRSRGVAVGTHNECGAQTMAEHASGIVCERPLNLDKGVATLRQHHVERAPASLPRSCLDRGGRECCCVNRPFSR